MASKIFLSLLILTLCKEALQNVEDNLVENDNNPFEGIKNDIINEENLKNFGGVLSNFMQSEGGKQLGDMIMDGMSDGNNNMMSQILQGVGSLMQQNVAKSNKGETGTIGGINPEIMGSIFNMMMSQQKTEGNGGFDMGTVLQMLTGMSNQDSAGGFMNFLSSIMQMFTSFTGPEAQRRAREHADHAWMLPPLVEKVHIFLDYLVNSEMGIVFMESTGINKALKLFSDENGKFSYDKFVEMFENHSFRKHWISMATKKVAGAISYLADPYTQRKFATTFQLFINNFLKGQGVPKKALFDTARPTESLTALANHYSKKYLGYKIDSKKYIQPAVAYFQELLGLAEEKGIVGKSVDSEKLSHRIADTINLEIIEPVVRVNRAYRFATKVPQCVRYVMCLVNQETPNEEQSIPGLKTALSKISSMVASWFLSNEGSTSFWSLYNVIMEESNCQARYLDECHDFHVEEIKVTTEYVHNEL